MGSKTTTKSDNNPPEWAKPAFELAGKETMRLYESGEGGNPYLGSTVADLSDTTMSGVNQLAQAGQSWDTAGTRGLFGAIGAGLAPTASGQMLGANPFIDEVVGRASEDIAGGANLMASAAGRYGSGGHQAVTQNAIGDMASQIRFGNYNAERDRQMQGLGMAHDVAGSMAGLDQQNFQNQLAGAGATLQAGGILDDQAQKQLHDDVNLFYQLDNAGWDRLAMLEAGAGGAAGPYGTQMSVSRTSNPAAALGAIGTGLSGTNLKSDMRVKENIRRVGTLDNGLPVYAYRYKEGGPTVIGVMAQEVLAVNPDAVTMEADGFYAVNYDMAVEREAA